ncbi:MAG: hypothetical protein ACTSWX_03065 [Promethearchaeota archaeon]
MNERKNLLERIQKDNITNITKQSQIESYFDFSNPKSKKRNIILIFGILNFPFILTGIIIFPRYMFVISTLWKISLVVVFTATLLINIILFIQKKPAFRFSSYALVVFGMVCLLIPILISLDEAYQRVLFGFLIIIDLIFTINYATIEYSKERYMSPMIRKNKMRNFRRLGYDKWEDT